jgi:hypothetical protein
VEFTFNRVMTLGVKAAAPDNPARTHERSAQGCVQGRRMPRVALMWDPSDLASARGYKAAESHARLAGLHLISVSVPRREDLVPALNA